MNSQVLRPRSGDPAPVGIAIGYRTRTDDGTCCEAAGFRRVSNERREVEGHVNAGVRAPKVFAVELYK